MIETILTLGGFLFGVWVAFKRERAKREKDPLWKDILDAVAAGIEESPKSASKYVKNIVQRKARELGVESILNAYVKGEIE